MPNVVTVDGLSPQERVFVEWMAQGLTQTQSATRAGYSSPSSSGHDLMQRQIIKDAIKALHGTHEELALITRKEFIEGIKEGIDMARTLADPQTMIVGWRELGRACGYYEPELKKLEVTVAGNVTVEKLQQMTDEELLKIYEGTAERLED